MVPVLALPEGGEWIVILVIVVLLFGAKKLPELTRNAAKAMKEFEKARQGDDETPAQVTQNSAQPQVPVQTQPATQAPAPAQPQAAAPAPAPAQPVDSAEGELGGGGSESAR
ncbi:twin-arginine translocase TatA/TatE family subunit [Kribbella sp. NPDC059898]|uniref:twin-arginine translocase TatA/TatE family subunit n=1 Tax=Kribbella sp. NPDC059898 TaxID=3346995 RepID=UPI0036532DDD